MKKKIISLVMCATLMFSLSACGSEGDKSNKKELNIYVWTEYVPDSVIEKFEDETGIKVNVSTFSSNEDMLAKVKAESDGTFDIVQPTDYMVEQLISQDMLEKLDKDKLTNIGNMNEAYMNPSYDPGNVYSIPYQGGMGAIGVNTSKIEGTITCYNDLFKPEYKNTLVVLDDTRALIGITSKTLGYSMNETDPAKLEEVKTKLLTLKDNIKLYDSDSPKSALISGDCTLAFCWSAEIALAMEENPDIQIVFPEEGAFLFMDNWCVTKGAKNYDEAMEFINFMMEPENVLLVMEEFPYLNPNQAAMDQNPEYASNPAKNPPAEEIAKGEHVQNVDTATLEILDQMWTELKQ